MRIIQFKIARTHIIHTSKWAERDVFETNQKMHWFKKCLQSEYEAWVCEIDALTIMKMNL